MTRPRIGGPPGPGRAPATLAATALIVFALPLSAQGNAADRAVVTSTVEAFHAALATADSAGALRLLHPAVLVYESGHAETLEEYRSGHLSADMEFSGSVERDVISEQVFGRGDQAVYLAEYRMAGSFRGEELEVGGTETMVLTRTEDGWRIRHIHWSSR